MICLACNGSRIDETMLDTLSCMRCQGTGEVDFSTEQEIKAMCTPDIIKKMCELSEGFKDYPKTVSLDASAHLKNDIVNWCMFPLLIHRAFTGWIAKNEKTFIQSAYHINLIHNANGKDRLYVFSNYRPENLTQLELACLHCLIEILKEEI